MRVFILCLSFVLLFVGGCKAELETSLTNARSVEEKETEEQSAEAGEAYKLSADNCTDPALSDVVKGKSFMLCDGSIGIGTYIAPALPDLSNLVAANIKSGVSINEITGSYNGGGVSNCASEGEQNCVNAGNFKAADITGLAVKIKIGQTVAGEAGSYSPDFPDVSDVRTSATVDNASGTLADCAVDGETSCFTDASFPAAKVADIDAWDIRVGESLGGVSGALKMNCRNMVGHYDGAAYSGGATILHTIDDYNHDGGSSGDFPSTNPWGSDDYFCGFNDPTSPSWELVEAVTASTPEGDAIYRDKISGLKWTRGDPSITKDWDDTAGGGADTGAIEYCASLTHGSGGDTWRLPTQKELMSAYEHGIYDLDSEHTDIDANPASGDGDNLGDLDTWFWSASTQSNGTSLAWGVTLDNGLTNANFKTNSLSVLCVSP